MTFIWTVFMMVTFVLEPLFKHRGFMERAIKNSEKTFVMLHRMHKILLSLSVVAVLDARTHGLSF